MGGIQAALIVALRKAVEAHVSWPITLMAVLSAVLLAAGVLRHYWDIYIHRTVRGISFIFVGIDAAGDLFSLVSVFFQPQLDILGMVIYGTELVLWLGVFAAGGYYNFLPWIKKRIDKHHSSGAQDNDQAAEANDQNIGITLHDLPSSTSVFRTPSGQIETIRGRGGQRQSMISDA